MQDRDVRWCRDKVNWSGQSWHDNGNSGSSSCVFQIKVTEERGLRCEA